MPFDDLADFLKRLAIAGNRGNVGACIGEHATNLGTNAARRACDKRTLAVQRKTIRPSHVFPPLNRAFHAR